MASARHNSPNTSQESSSIPASSVSSRVQRALVRGTVMGPPGRGVTAHNSGRWRAGKRRLTTEFTEDTERYPAASAAQSKSSVFLLLFNLKKTTECRYNKVSCAP